jgi:hypothetical protein
MSERFDPSIREINERRFKREAESSGGKPSLLQRVFGKGKMSHLGPAEEEARILDRWRDIKEQESRSPLNELSRENGAKVYRPYIIDTPGSVEAYANHDSRWRLGFSLGYSIARMFGAVPDESMLPRILGGMEENKLNKESFNDLIFRSVEKKIRDRKDPSVPVRVMELAAGRTYGESSYQGLYGYNVSEHYGVPWIARLLKMRFGDDVDVSICDMVNDWVKKPGTIDNPQEDPGPIVLGMENGVLKFCDDTKEHPLGNVTGPASIAPTKRFLPTATEEGRGLVPRPRLDPVFEKMAFGVNAYGNVDMRTNQNIRAFLGSADETFDLIFAKNAYALPTEKQIAQLLSDSGTYMSGGFWQGDAYYPIDNLVERKGKGIELPKRHTPDEFDRYLQEKGFLPEGRSIYRADAAELDKEAKELLSLMREGFAQGVAEAKKQLSL